MADSPKSRDDETTQEEDAKTKAYGAPKTESPESPAAPPVQAKGEESVREAPEDYIAPPAEDVRYGDVQSGGTRSGGVGLSTYLSFNAAGSPPSMTGIDTGVASAPFDRPTTFSPTGAGLTTPAPFGPSDYGTGAQMANRANVFDPPLTTTTYVDPGAF